MAREVEEEVAWRCFCKDVVPFTAMVAVECVMVGSNTLFKAATMRGLSFYVFVFYNYVVATLVLLPLSLLFRRGNRFISVIAGCKGIEYSSPTLASAISNLTPAFTFTLAIIFRMEKVVLRSSATQAKIIGTMVSISDHRRSINSCTVFACFNLVDSSDSDHGEDFSSFLLKPGLPLVSVMFSGGLVSSLGSVIHTWGLHLKGPVYISLFKPMSIVIAVAMGV
ncbi:WAT1-related protein [Raphanus sativus]|nr:WAT1-related protein [Raphanus sativus]